MDIKKSIEQKVNQTVESLITDFEAGYIGCLIGNEVIKVKVKLDAKISSVEFDTDSKEPVIVDLVRELNEDYGKKEVHIFNLFCGSKSNPRLKLDDFYYLSMMGMPHLVTALEKSDYIFATIVPNVPHYNLSDGDWVWINYGELDVCNFALVYRDELYYYNFSQLVHEPIEEINYTKLIFV